MAPIDTTLLCLGLCLAHAVPVPVPVLAQEGDLPTPFIYAVPGPVVPWNASLRILCWGTPKAFLYQLLVLGNSTLAVVDKQLGFQQQAEFILSSVDASTARQYCCCTGKGSTGPCRARPWDVVTGLYNKPFLSMDQHSVVMPGENVSFQCHSAHIPFDRFALAKEGDTSLPQHQHEGHQGNFTLGPMNPSFAGKYICYGWLSSSPQVWSAPSDALELIIAAPAEPRTRELAAGNAVRLGAAALVLAALLALGAEHWRSHRAERTEREGRGNPAGADGGAGRRGPGPGHGGHR